MIRHNEECRIEVRELNNSLSKITLKHLINEDEFCNSGRLMCEITVSPKGKINFHQHVDEFEVYYIIQGKGLYNDNNEIEQIVKKGDVTYCPSGSSHSIENLSDNEDLVFIGVINKCIN